MKTMPPDMNEAARVVMPMLSEVITRVRPWMKEHDAQGIELFVDDVRVRLELPPKRLGFWKCFWHTNRTIIANVLWGSVIGLLIALYINLGDNVFVAVGKAFFFGMMGMWIPTAMHWWTAHRKKEQ